MGAQKSPNLYTCVYMYIHTHTFHYYIYIYIASHIPVSHGREFTVRIIKTFNLVFLWPLM